MSASEVDLRALARTGPVHFVGIAGSGMSALAELILRSGGQVTGCDARPGSVGMTLEGRGAVVVQGHDPEHVADAVAVVTTAAVKPEHPELVAARGRGIPVLKRAQALGALVNRGTVVAVAGTHGKTTTTAMTTAILEVAGMDPTGFVGGRVAAWGGGLRLGSETLFVVEADEYDRSFHQLRPDIAIVTTVEPDHMDIFGSAEAVDAAFREFLTPLSKDGLLVACVDDEGAARLLAERPTSSLGYGLAEGAALRAEGLRAEGLGTRFDVVEGGRSVGELTVGSPGEHNVRNALAAYAAARHLGATLEAAREALGGFRGVDRRFQVLGEVDGVVVVDDYAHHPTEVRATLEAARRVYPGRRLVAVFQPHLYTRTRDFADAFGRALAGADRVWVTDVYAAREEPIPGVDGELVARAAGEGVRYHGDVETLPEVLAGAVEEGDVVLAMGAGNIDEAARRLFAVLGGGAAVGPGTREDA